MPNDTPIERLIRARDTMDSRERELNLARVRFNLAEDAYDRTLVEYMRSTRRAPTEAMDRVNIGAKP